MINANAADAMPNNGATNPEPTLVDHQELVLDPMTAYQMTSMLQGVVQRGHRHRAESGR